MRGCSACGSIAVALVMVLAAWASISLGHASVARSEGGIERSLSPSLVGALDAKARKAPQHTTVPVGSEPAGVVFDPSTHELFVANHNSSNVSVISDTTDTVVATVGLLPVALPWGVAYDPSKHEVFVADSGDNSVSVISAATNSVVTTVPVGGVPMGVVYDPSKHEVFVANSGTDNVSVICDGSRGCPGARGNIHVVATVAVQNAPCWLTYDPSKHEVFVANSGANDASVISDTLDAVVSTIDLGMDPHGLAYDSATHEVFVANAGSNSLSVISDTENRVVATVTVGSQPEGVAYDAAKHEVFVTNFNSSNLSVVSGRTDAVVGSVSSGNGSIAIASDPTKHQMFVLDWDENSVVVVSVFSPLLLTNVLVGEDPWAEALDPSMHEVFVTNLYGDSVSVISTLTNKVVATVSVGSYPDGVAYDPTMHEMFVANGYSNTVSVISDATNMVVATVSGFDLPTSVAYDSRVHEVFVSNFETAGTVSVICDGSASCGGSVHENVVVATVAVGSHPWGVAYFLGGTGDTISEVFVANEFSDNISVICDGAAGCGGLSQLDRVVATVSLPVGSSPLNVAPVSGVGVLVTDFNSGNVSEISAATYKVTATIHVGSAPWGVWFDPATQSDWVTMIYHSVSVISAFEDNIVATVLVPQEPSGVVGTSNETHNTYEVFVANGADTVTVISEFTPI